LATAAIGFSMSASGESHRSRAPSKSARPSACQAAVAEREKALQAAGMRRDFDLLRRLNDRVFAACQHP
jgi:hypothetical protein